MIPSTKTNTQLVCFYFFYRPKKNAYIIDITNDDQKYNAFAQTYGDGSTFFQRHMISFAVSFPLKYTIKYVGGLCSYRVDLL